MRVVIAGFGVEGKASYDYWANADHEVVIADEREQVEDLPDGVQTMLGSDAFSKLGDFDLIIRAPSVNPKKLPYEDRVWSATNEFFEKCPAPIIGVTGTKGKGTTSSLIASILNAAGKTVHLVGNIGTPALDELPNVQPTDIVVYELSSFQLWDVKYSPHVAVVLMIEPDHLDIHEDLEEYKSVKGNIARFQKSEDVVIFNSQDHVASAIAHASQGQKYPYKIQPRDEEMSDFYVGETRVAAKESLKLPGAHNVDNTNAAILASWQFTQDVSAIERGIGSFTGLPHRLKFIREVNEVKYYDDSIATTPGSAVAALRSFSEPKVIILGGSDKGASYEDVIDLCDETRTKVIAIGQTGPDIAELCAQLGVVCEEVEGDMTTIVARADEVAKPGEVVILSPAAASFDMFKSYADRGDQFAAAVNAL